ncbi:MAG: glycosyltransferase family 4 protein [Coleofasciculus chthonoplastes F3-SA18-01]|uniref:glycosyltransferase family 4 protein n=1 Tax=Coleofasciculus chthonoplastes TaxID=64178 RepID=UPI0033005A10
MQNLTIISQYFYPNSASTAQLITDLSRGFAERGYVVKVLTSGHDHSKINLVDGFLSQIKINRTPYINWHNQNIFIKVFNSLIFLFISFAYIIFNVNSKNTLLIVSNPPYSGILGLGFKIFKQGKFYFLLQDIFPESAVLIGIIKSSSFLFKFFSYLTYLTCKYSQNTIVLSSSMKLFLGKKYSDIQENDKIEIVENWSIEDIYIYSKKNNEFAIQHGFDKLFTILYSGNLGRLHDIESIVFAAQSLNDTSIQFVFIGDGAKQKLLERYIQEHQLKNILLLPFQPRDVLSQSLTACDVSLVSLIEGAEEIIAPCKLYGMLAAGRAILSISSTGSYIDQLLNDYSCGINCPPNNPQQLAETIAKLAADPERVTAMGKRARQLYEEKYTFSRALDEYEKLLFNTELLN